MDVSRYIESWAARMGSGFNYQEACINLLILSIWAFDNTGRNRLSGRRRLDV